MNTTPRVFTTSRIAALLLIGLLAGGLGYLRFGGPDPVSVPAGARAGQLSLHSCQYDTEDGSYAADCGKVIVPENRADPGSRLIALPVTRIRARNDSGRAPVFRMQGGPGVTNMVFPQASRFAKNRDVVLVGYRGVDGSSVLQCPEVIDAVGHSADYGSAKSMRAYNQGFADCAQRLESEGTDLAGYTIPQRIDDFEAVRKALGYRQIDLVSESVGTRMAMIYPWRHPESIHRSVMIAVNPPGRYLWDPKATNEQLRHYAALCSEAEACSDRTRDLTASVDEALADIPDRWGPFTVKRGQVRVAAFYGLFNSIEDAAGPLAAPITLDTLVSAANGDESGLWFMSLMADLAFPRSFVWGDVASIARIDGLAADRRYAAKGRPASVLADAGTAFMWGGGGLHDAWPPIPDERQYNTVQDSDVETLLVGGTLDFSTPPQNGKRDLLPHLPNGRQAVLRELGHAEDFWAYQPEASTRLVSRYLDSGTVDRSLYKPRAEKFQPTVTHTALAKGVAAGMTGFALLTIWSVFWWMPRRVHRSGGFGRKSGAVLRSLYPVVLGFGGWFVALLIVLTSAPTVALDSEVMGVLSISAPVGLGIYWAWLRREWPGRTKAAGFAMAMAGALLSGWLAFHAGEGMGAILTTIGGATAGANLVLILYGMARDRKARERMRLGAAVHEPAVA